MLIKKLKEVKKYLDYIDYYAKCIMRQRVAGSLLGSLWLFLDPLMFMLIYTFIVKYIFQNNTPNFHIIVFIGLNAWKLFNSTIMLSATSIIRHKAIINQINFPKYIYPLVYALVNLYEYIIASSLVFVLIYFSKIPFTFHIFEMIPITIVLFIFSISLSLLVAHLGVYFLDLRNILDFSLRFLFYLSPIMWSFSSMSDGILKNILLLNPIALILESYRNVLLNNQSANYLGLMIILLISLFIMAIGFKTIEKYEKNYGKVI